MQRETVFLSTTPGLEDALEREAAELGGTVRRVSGGFEVEGAPGLHEEACLRLRTASHVLLRIGDASSKNFDVRPFCSGGVKIEFSGGRAAPELRKILNAWPKGETRALVRIDGDRAWVSIDCAGELLFRRGYRQEVSRAPMRETLAAGMLMLGGYDGSTPLWDPLCGSGTLLIEGAWIASRRAPGLTRSFDFERWPSFDARAFEARKERLRAELRKPPFEIRGGDLNAGSLGVARRNARRAAVELKLERADALKLAPAGPPGFFVANLPYGKRVGGDADVNALHRSLGEALRRHWQGWTALLLCGGEEEAAALGLEGEAWDVDNGGLDCVLLRVRL